MDPAICVLTIRSPVFLKGFPSKVYSQPAGQEIPYV